MGLVFGLAFGFGFSLAFATRLGMRPQEKQGFGFIIRFQCVGQWPVPQVETVIG